MTKYLPHHLKAARVLLGAGGFCGFGIATEEEVAAALAQIDPAFCGRPVPLAYVRDVRDHPIKLCMGDGAALCVKAISNPFALLLAEDLIAAVQRRTPNEDKPHG